MPQIVVRMDAQGRQTPAWVEARPRITMADIQRHGSYDAARKAREIG